MTKIRRGGFGGKKDSAQRLGAFFVAPNGQPQAHSHPPSQPVLIVSPRRDRSRLNRRKQRADTLPNRHRIAVFRTSNFLLPPAFGTALVLIFALGLGRPAFAQMDDSTKQLSRGIFKQLIEINTTDSVGSTIVAANAMAERLRNAGFAPSDVQVLGPNDRKGNLVARLRGSGKEKPILLMGHLDVVEARHEDWSMDPFEFNEKDGFFYGRDTQDMKSGDAFLVTTLIRLKKENYRPDRDLIQALTADEEGGKPKRVGVTSYYDGVEFYYRYVKALTSSN